ncbi:MAG TPA: hypothetical protein VH008_25675, partial [Pseudonocardia sp.]|nr:hypothetical protein [Pseudonocardia sp.]
MRPIRRDAVRMLRAAGADTRLLVDAAELLPRFDRPALVIWASEDRVMSPEHGRRLAELLPDGRLVEVADSYTLIPLDQPTRLAQPRPRSTSGAAAGPAIGGLALAAGPARCSSRRRCWSSWRPVVRRPAGGRPPGPVPEPDTIRRVARPTSSSVTMRDIAESLGISVSAVSLALRERPGVG